jgi:hypothetical protein
VKPFWQLDTRDELALVKALLQRRFPTTWAVLTDCLDEADPLDIVYPGNPGEYDDVVEEEMLVLLAPVDGDLARLSELELRSLVADGLARCFDTPPEPERVERLVTLLRAHTTAAE